MERPPEQSRPFVIIGEVGRMGGRPVLELAEPQDLVRRRTLWPGLPPPAVPSHPGLLPVVLAGRLEDLPVWLESRPLGHALEELLPLEGDESIAILRDLVSALRALHARGQSHGRVRDTRVLITTEGRAVFLGTGSHSGQVNEDIADLVRMGRSFGGERLKLPETVPNSLQPIADSLDALAENADLRATRKALGKRVTESLSPISDEAPNLHIAVVDGSTVQPVDEIGMDLGFGDSRYDTSSSWSGTASEVTGEATGDLTSPHGLTETPSRAQAIAKVLASPPFPIDPARFASREGQPCKGVIALLASETPDPLPIGEERSANTKDAEESESWLPQAMADLAGLDRPTVSGGQDDERAPPLTQNFLFAPTPEFDDITESAQEEPEITPDAPAPVRDWYPDLTTLERNLLLVILTMTLAYLLFG